MNPEIGHLCLITAFVFSLAQVLIPMVGIKLGRVDIIKFTTLLQIFSSWAIFFSFFILVWAFAVSDFSVQLVESHSHSTKPLIYKLTGTWGNHEGSLLLWIVILGMFGMLFVLRQAEGLLKTYSLMIMGMISSAFIAFSLFTSNPFTRLDPAPLDGRGLNPVLQDIGLAIHPPILYFGYVGLSMAFSIAIAGLLIGRIDKDWARVTKFWVNLAWSALTIGIALGSWWAYYELGWGGWWFWDPVENASLMPWLAATALLHCVTVVEKRGHMVSWTVLMAITAFSLSLLGTFIVRSGLLTSVHSFASDPARGIFILIILLASVGLPLLLYAWRGPQLAKSVNYQIISRDSGLIINNYILLVSTFTVLIGTFYPLGLELFTGAKITVGAPYFDATFTPVMAIAVFAMAIGPLLVWRGGLGISARFALSIAGVCAVLTVLGLSTILEITISELAGTGLLVWLGISILCDIGYRIKPWRAGWLSRFVMPAPQWGMWVAHFGMVVFLSGVVGSSVFEEETIVRSEVGATIMLGQDKVIFDGVEQVAGPNYISKRAQLRLIGKDGQHFASLFPEQRFYPAERQSTTEAAIRPRLLGDYYAVLGDGDAETGYTLRLYYKPLISWIWGGAGLMALGGIIALFGRSPKKQVQV